MHPLLALSSAPSGPEITLVLVLSVALLAGAAMRFFSARIRLPYTVAMLLLGLGIAYALRASGVGEGGAGEHGGGLLAGMAHASQGISPDLIVFIFLPALIFESAYSLNVHAFKQGLRAIVWLAVPALVAATFLTAYWMKLIMPASWNWPFLAALVFGALISATDPVAVVALMRELGVSKRLATLIEGESLLNDGTAIVVFNVLLAMLVGTAGGGGVWHGVEEFVIVVAGGLLVGLVFASIVSWWIGRSFNDPLVEITLTILLSYAAMFVCEAVFPALFHTHVSGVMALVFAGLWMSGPGRIKISPEVHHFLHQFWEMLAYIANTLVFFLVGLVIGWQVEEVTLVEVGVIVAAWAGIMVIRAIVTFGFRPLANIGPGDKVSTKDAMAAVWGGLRGAVSMALALAISQNEEVPATVRQQMLLVTAGVVLLTLTVNGTTMAALLRKLGLAATPLSERLAGLTARAVALADVDQHVRALADSPELKTVGWASVERDLERRTEDVRRERELTRRSLQSAPPRERAAGVWRQMLSIERGAYWHAFEEGTLGGQAVRVLENQIDLQLDRLRRGDPKPPETRIPEVGPLAAWTRRTIRSRDWYTRHFAQIEFENLAMLYDLCRGESAAATSVLSALDKLKGIDPGVAKEIRDTYWGYHRHGKEELEAMRVHLPELAEAIEMRLAQRIVLSLEKEEYEKLSHSGALDPAIASGFVEEVEERLYALRRAPRRLPLPATHELLAEVPIFEPLHASALKQLADQAATFVVPKGEHLFLEGQKGDSLFVVARGAVEVLRKVDGRETPIGMLGGGDILGEMALLTGEPRNASIRAATSVTVIKIDRAKFTRLMSENPHLESQVWDAFASRHGDNFLRRHPRFRHLDQPARHAWMSGREHVSLESGASYAARDGVSWVYVVSGSVSAAGEEHEAPALLEEPGSLQAKRAARLVLLPQAPDEVLTEEGASLVNNPG